jgi:DNA-binding transcriptional LysR family regulator
MDRIEMMRAFAMVAKEGSFTAAARRLGHSTKLVSKYVQHLEARLQTRLLNRTTRSVTLTDIGRAYLERSRALLDQFDELDTLMMERQTSLAGPIRITAPTGYGSARLTRTLASFMSRHPKVEVDLKLTDQRVALVEEGFDLAVRIGELRDSTLIARKLADMPLLVCASPSYLERHGRPGHPMDLATHACLIDTNQSNPTLWRFRSQSEELHVRVNGPFHANAPAAVAEMAVGGLGIARSPRYAVETAMQDGRLAPLLVDYNSGNYGLYALYPTNRHLTARVRALIDHLVKTANAAS